MSNLNFKKETDHVLLKPAKIEQKNMNRMSCLDIIHAKISEIFQNQLTLGCIFQ